MVLGGLAINHATDYPDRALVRPEDYLIAIQACRSRGDTGRAIAEAERAREIFPGIGLFHRLAGLLQLEAGNLTQARSALEEALARDPGDDEARRALERIGREPLP